MKARTKVFLARGTHRRRWAIEAAFVLSTLTLGHLLVGCAATLSDRAERMQRGYVYYLDGAGGGGIRNWSGGVRTGLLNAGYDGAGEMFRWETGLGMLADQTASNEYKREKAAKLVQKMVTYRELHPQAPITMIGLSAGTVITVFALELLPSDIMVENVFLLSGSLSASHDLTDALRHVRGKMYVSTSQRDFLLGGLLPFAGTADRGSGTLAAIGTVGPRLPPSASAETRQAYASKLVVVPWRSEFARYGNFGTHTGTVSAAFIERYVAPLVETTSGVQFAAATTAPEGLVPNPDYRRWAQFPVGAWTIIEGQQTVDGATRPFHVKTTLVKKTPEVLVLRREQRAAADDAVLRLEQTAYESAYIAPTEHPLTHPARQVKELPNVKVRVGSEVLDCAVKTVSVPADFSDWGDRPQATIGTHEQVPGGIVQVDIRTRWGEQRVAIEGRLVDFYVPTE
jgi:hypothetical protein